MDKDKLVFITTGFMPLLINLPANTKGHWGKMNAQQMVEHVTGFFAISTGKIKFPLVTPVENLPKMRAFLYSDKPFRENTVAPVLPEEPLPVRFADMELSIAALDKEIKLFVKHFTEDDALIRMHPVFGELNFEEWVLLHHKHVTHHARQFGLL